MKQSVEKKKVSMSEPKIGTTSTQIFLFSLLEQFGKIRISSCVFISTLRLHVHCFSFLSRSPPVPSRDYYAAFRNASAIRSEREKFFYAHSLFWTYFIKLFALLWQFVRFGWQINWGNTGLDGRDDVVRIYLIKELTR